MFIIYLLLLFYSVKSETDDNAVICADTQNVQQFCSAKKCISKCCGVNEMLFYENGAQICKDVTEIEKKYGTPVKANFTDLKIYTMKGETKQLSSKKSRDFEILINKNKYENDCFSIVVSPKNNVFIIEDGSFVMISENTGIDPTRHSPSEYCADDLGYDKNGTMGKTIVYRIIEGEPIPESKILFKAIGVSVSALFLLLTLIVYCLLKTLRNIQGKILMAYLFTLFLNYITLAIMNLGIEYGALISIFSISISNYYFMFSSFFWLNIMSFDIWWTFRGTRKVREIHKRGEKIKFMWYSLYAWGTPLIITITAGVIDCTDQPSHVIKPYFKNGRPGGDISNYYIHLPMAILEFINVVLFACTIYNIVLMKRDIARFGKDAKNENTKQRFSLYLKVASVMGVTWIVDILDSYLDEKMPAPLSYILNIYNYFIGVVLFIIFVCKPKIWRLLRKRFNGDTVAVTGISKNSSMMTSGETSKSLRSTVSNKQQYADDKDNISEL